MTGPARAQLFAIGTSIGVAATDPHQLEPALDLLRTQLDRLDKAISRFRPDSEISLLAHVKTSTERGWAVSQLVRNHLHAADRAHRLSDGLVDPTVGAALVRAGYDADLATVRQRPATELDTREIPVVGVTGWPRVHLHSDGTVSLPQGTLLDLGATGKAHAADTIAARLAHFLPGGFLVDLGGDVASAGPRPVHGWRLGIEGPGGEVAQVVSMEGLAFATSSTQARTWNVGGRERHHVIDPRTGRVAVTPWAQVTCAARTTLDANAASTAAVILGDAAPAWLATKGVPARLEHRDGAVVTTAGWPQPRRRASGVRSA